MNEQAPPVIADEVVIAAIETVLKPLGTSLRHYEARHKSAAITAMRGVLMAQIDRDAAIHAGEMIRMLRLVGAAIREGRQ